MYTNNVIKLDLRQYLDRSPDGLFVVRAFTDLKRHDMCDLEVNALCNEERRQDNVAVRVFMMQKLWDLATSAPYCHRGDCTSLSEAILVHGGEGRAARELFLNCPMQDKRSLLAFLNSLVVVRYLN